MKSLLLPFLLLNFIFSLSAQTSIFLLPASQAKDFFNYEDELKISDEIGNDYKKMGDFLWGRSYEAKDRAFAYCTVLYQYKSILSVENVKKLALLEKESQEKFLKKAAEKEEKIKQTKDPNKQKELLANYEKWRTERIENQLLRSIKLSNGATGFIQPLGFGPGGAALIANVSDPSKKFDLALTLFINSFDDTDSKEIQLLPATKKYQEKLALKNMPDLLKNALESIYPEMERQYRKLYTPPMTNSVPAQPQKP
ncbi:MAG: hypothetical protein K1X66_06225 [Verrucomicrobiae bacterium]|nr:hypothetical protein [Verrucomicrobiae bacterium]